MARDINYYTIEMRDIMNRKTGEQRRHGWIASRGVNQQMPDGSGRKDLLRKRRWGLPNSRIKNVDQVGQGSLTLEEEMYN